jgi:hypothetical protein
MMSKVKVNWYQYLSLGFFVAGWISRAAIDGKISREEVNELVSGIFEMLGTEDIRFDD